MLVSEIIAKTRDGRRLDDAEILFLVDGFASGKIPDYQAAAWLMAAYLKGLSTRETKTLTEAMKNSGKSLDWKKLRPDFEGFCFVDKHSTGGVGDKVSLMLAPIAACMGVKVPMMSGRGLGHTGGTVDKLQSIPGFSMYPSLEKMLEALDKVGVAMMGQSKDLCPADRKLYSLRDVTSTVDNVPLITASILSKKWAEGAEKIVFDVKCGPAAFMDTVERARELSQSLVSTARKAGIESVAMITRMDEPLGRMVGNALEVVECLEILKQKFPSEKARILAHDLTELTLDQAAEMAYLAKIDPHLPRLKEWAREVVLSGEAYQKFCEMAEMQGAVAGWEKQLPQAKFSLALKSKRSGFVRQIFSRALGLLAVDMGAGRIRAEDHVDPAVGFELMVRVGDKVKVGDTLMICHVNEEAWFRRKESEMASLFELRNEAVAHPASLVMEKIC